MMRLISLALAEAAVAARAIEEAAARQGTPAAIAVADCHGEPIVITWMDGSPIMSFTVAANKAFSAVRAAKPTRAIGEAARSPNTGFDIGYYGDARFVGWPGGLPVWYDGAVIGAVAVSGAGDDPDEELAQIGVDALDALIQSQ